VATFSSVAVFAAYLQRERKSGIPPYMIQALKDRALVDSDSGKVYIPLAERLDVTATPEIAANRMKLSVMVIPTKKKRNKGGRN